MASYKNKPLFLCLALVLILGLLSGCGGKGEEAPPPADEEGEAVLPEYSGGDGKFSLNFDSSYSFNPLTTVSVDNLLCAQLMYETLFELDESFEPQPKLVESFETEDGKYWKFYVNTDIKFWDGSGLTASDASYSIQRAQQSKLYGERLKSVIGASALDERCFVINVQGTNMNIPALLNIPVIKNGSIEESTPQGTGPYMPDQELAKLTAFSGHRSYASLPVSEVYLREAPEIEDKIASFESRETDLVTNDPSGTFNLGYGAANEVRYYPTTNLHYLGFNTKSSFFSRALCRRAMTYVVDRETLVTSYLGGAAVPASLPMNPAAALYNDGYSDLLAFSIKKAESAFDEAEVQDYDEDGKREILVTGIPIEIELDFIVCSDSPAKVQAAALIAETLNKMGITVNLRSLNWDDYIATLKAGNFDMYYAETRLLNDFSLKKLVFFGESLNYGKFTDSALEQYVIDFMASKAGDRQRAADLMFKHFTDSSPFVPICFERHQVITHRGVVAGLRPTRDNVFLGLEDWEIHIDG